MSRYFTKCRNFRVNACLITLVVIPFRLTAVENSEGDSKNDKLPPIRFIPFNNFKKVGSFPRFPDNSNVCVNLHDIDVENSLLVFISHSWLRGWHGAEGWDGRAHPDNATGGKYELCVDGIEQILKTCAPGFDRCYIWLDYGCIDQNAGPAGELKQLDKIVGVCDCLFTPIYDADHASWSRPSKVTSLFEDYQSTGWRGSTYSYVNRGWCRVEMFYGANIPLNEDSEERKLKMRAGLLYHRSCGRRPHFLYGSKDQGRQNPRVLPPLQNSYFDEYHPVKGNVTVDSDKAKIIQLVKDLEPYMRKVVVGLVLDDDSDSDAVIRKGTYTYGNGDVYVGEFVNDRPHGYGKLEYADGNVYEGQYIDGKKNGHGKFTFASGDVYEGDWKDNNVHGQGRYTYASGDVYEGQYIDGNKNGHGKYTYVNGDVYEGNFKDSKMNGRGQYTHANGGKSDGGFKDNVQHGTITYTYADGRVTCREYVEGKLISENPITI
jgi:hypothetical protein